MGDATRTFERLRPRLKSIAYRILGSESEVELVQRDAYLRWHEVALAEQGRAEAWLISTVARLCLDRFGELIESASDSTESGSGLPERSLVKLMWRILSQPAHRNIADILLFKLELTSDNPRLLRCMQEAHRECVCRITTLLSLAVHRRHLPAEFAVRQASLFIHASILGVIGQELFIGRQRDSCDFFEPFAKALVASIMGATGIATPRLNGHTE